jgi:hypothetical protein
LLKVGCLILVGSTERERVLPLFERVIQAPVVVNAAGPYSKHLIQACENGHDHDSDPVVLQGRFSKNAIKLGHYSRLREPHAESTNNVLG